MRVLILLCAALMPSCSMMKSIRGIAEQGKAILEQSKSSIDAVTGIARDIRGRYDSTIASLQTQFTRATGAIDGIKEKYHEVVAQIDVDGDGLDTDDLIQWGAGALGIGTLGVRNEMSRRKKEKLAREHDAENAELWSQLKVLTHAVNGGKPGG